MRSMMVMLIVTASMTGCAAQVPEGESEGATAKAEGSTASALRNGGGFTESCPGGGAPACVTCTDDLQCVYACAGGNTCRIDPGSCGTIVGECRTVSFAPGDFAKRMY